MRDHDITRIRLDIEIREVQRRQCVFNSFDQTISFMRRIKVINDSSDFLVELTDSFRIYNSTKVSNGPEFFPMSITHIARNRDLLSELRRDMNFGIRVRHGLNRTTQCIYFST
ncbi:hypothetical protein D3C72_1501180 [compost metagenome]